MKTNQPKERVHRCPVRAGGHQVGTTGGAPNRDGIGDPARRGPVDFVLQVLHSLTDEGVKQIANASLVIGPTSNNASVPT